jgi:hypothetical protein
MRSRGHPVSVGTEPTQPRTTASTRAVARVVTALVAGVVAWLVIGLAVNVVTYITADPTDERSLLHQMSRLFSPWALVGAVVVGVGVFLIGRRSEDGSL